MTMPTTIAKPASTYGPRLSELTPFRRAVSAAIAELKLPTEFSLISNHPMFLLRIEL
jgi:hypothetical protein